MYNNESINRIDDSRDYFHCRICLEGMSSEKVRSYCNCRGSLEAIHHNCLLKWIQSSLAKNATTIDHVSCQICNYQLNTVYSKTWKLKEWKQITQICTQDFSTFNTVLFVFVLFFLLSMIITVILMKNLTKEETTQQNHIYVIAISTSLLFISLITLICSNIFKTEITLNGVKQISFQ